jgi:hypothetical protein
VVRDLLHAESFLWLVPNVRRMLSESSVCWWEVARKVFLVLLPRVWMKCAGLESADEKPQLELLAQINFNTLVETALWTVEKVKQRCAKDAAGGLRMRHTKRAFPGTTD